MLRLSVFCLVLVSMCSSASGAQSSVGIAGTAQYDLQSKTTGRVYRLFIAPPEAYSSTDTARYPVLVVLDGNALFPMAVGAYRYLRIFNQAPDVIIVGVGYPADFYRETVALRWTDLTPSQDSRADSINAPLVGSFLPDGKPVPLRSGGGPVFLEALRSEIIPFVDRAYRTSQDRALMGHSFGALLATYAMLTEPTVFSRLLCAPVRETDWANDLC